MNDGYTSQTIINDVCTILMNDIYTNPPFFMNDGYTELKNNVFIQLFKILFMNQH